MAFKMSYGQIKLAPFKQAWAKITNFPTFKDPKVAYNIAKIKKRLDEEFTINDELFDPIVVERKAKIEEIAVKGEDGKTAWTQGRDGVAFKPQEEKKAEWEEFEKGFEAKVAELNKIEFEVDRPKLKFPQDIACVNLTPNEIDAIESMLDVSFDEPAALAAVEPIKKG